jgi:hypothetical protein
MVENNGNYAAVTETTAGFQDWLIRKKHGIREGET